MSDQMNSTNEIRRKLLKAVVYAPPVILGSMVVTPRTAMAAIGDAKTCAMNAIAGVPTPPVSIVISSGTNACCPCIPGSTKFDPVKCSKSQCKKSCGLNCTPAQLAAINCEVFCKNCGFTPVGCNQPCVTCTPKPQKPGQFKCK